MTFLKTLKLAVCALALPVVMLSSTIAQGGAVLLYQQNYSEAISFSSTDATLLRGFYIVIANSPKSDGASNDIIIAPLETPSLSGSFSGSFIVNATAPARSAAASDVAGFDGRIAADTLRLYVGRSNSDSASLVDQFGSRDAALELVDSRFPGSNLAFVRFDVNQWEVSDSVVSYDIDISFWGQPAPEVKTVVAMDG